MKKHLIIIATLILAVACNRGNIDENEADTIPADSLRVFTTHNVKDEQNYIIYSDEEFPFGGNVIGLLNSYNIVWPDEGMLTHNAERELLRRYFLDDEAKDFESASRYWILDDSYYLENGCEVMRTNYKDDSLQYSYSRIESSCEQHNDIATINIYREMYNIGAVHGLYSSEYVNIDVTHGTIIHLNDLVDTNLLGPVIVRAVEDLTINSDVLKALLDQNPERLPVPPDFTIDSTRSTITLVYQVYEIASYADGIQEIVLPIFWLSKHIPLTPYAKRIFGPESYIE